MAPPAPVEVSLDALSVDSPPPMVKSPRRQFAKPEHPHGHSHHHHHHHQHQHHHRGHHTGAAVDSAIPALFKKSVQERVTEVAARTHLNEADRQLLGENHACVPRFFQHSRKFFIFVQPALTRALGFPFARLFFPSLLRLPLYVANEMVENVLGTTQLPFAVATNFIVNGRDVVVPMAVEEPSVVAAASFGAKLARASGGFRATAPPPLMLGQVLLVGLEDGRLEAAQRAILDAERRLIDLANSLHPSLKARGGGVQRVEPRALSTWRGPMLVVHVHVDVRDSMGANTVTTICEKLAPHLEELTGAVARMRILSNLCPDRVFTAEAVWTKQELAASVKNLGLTGDEVVEAMLDASAFAEADEFRACTHNKGARMRRRQRS